MIAYLKLWLALDSRIHIVITDYHEASDGRYIRIRSHAKRFHVVSRHTKSIIDLISYFLLPIFLIGLAIGGCEWTGISSEPDRFELTDLMDKNMPLFPEGQKIEVSEKNRLRFIKNILAADISYSQSGTAFYWTSITANDAIPVLNRRLADGDWNLVTDWGYQNGLLYMLSVWEKEDLKLSILLWNDLDSVGIAGLSKNYGISGPVPGSTMLVMHIVNLAEQ